MQAVDELDQKGGGQAEHDKPVRGQQADHQPVRLVDDDVAGHQRCEGGEEVVSRSLESKQPGGPVEIQRRIHALKLMFASSHSETL